MIETTTFRLMPGADESAFRAADAKVQTEVVYLQPGIMRRTTAKGDDGTWIVISVWASAAQADAAAAQLESSPVAAPMLALVDLNSVVTARYESLD